MKPATGVFHVIIDVLRRFFFVLTADLATHHDSVGFWILFEQLQRVDEVSSNDRIATDADRR